MLPQNITKCFLHYNYLLMYLFQKYKILFYTVSKNGCIFYWSQYNELLINNQSDLLINLVALKGFWDVFSQKTLAEFFYYVKYGSSIITSKVPSKFLSNENITCSFQKNNLLLHFNSRFVIKTETQVFTFSLLRFFDWLLTQ